MAKLSKLAIYFLVSLILAGILLYQTFSKEYVSVSLALTKLTNSKWKNAVIFNAVFATLLAVVASLIQLFFGEMREIERYDIIQWTKQKILSFAFIMIVLQEDLITTNLIVMFLGVLAWSIFHWLAIKRSEYLIMENQSNYKGHIKISILFCFLMVCDILMLQYFYERIFVSNEIAKSDRHLMALIGFEILILLLKIGSPFVKYFVNLIELLTLSHFERKSTLLSIAEFIFTITALTSELWLFYFIYQTFGTPLHLILEAIETVMNLVKTTTKFYSSIQLVRKLSKLPDVTEEDVKNIDSTCLICLHEISSGKKIPCGHIFHLNCLKGWIQGNVNQFCPKCKQPIKIDHIAPTSEAGSGAAAVQPNPELGLKTEKLSDLSFEINNVIIMKLYHEVLMDYEAQNLDTFKLSHQEKIRLIFGDILTSQELGKNAIGAVEYGLPRPAVSYKSSEAVKLAKKIKLMNHLVLSQYSTHSFFKVPAAPQQAPKETKTEGETEKVVYKNQIDTGKKQENEQTLQKAEPINQNPSTAKLIVLGEKEEIQETDEVRRRRLLLEAAERRAQETVIEETEENKKTQ